MVKLYQNVPTIVSGYSVLYLYSYAAYKKAKKLPTVLLVFLTVLIFMLTSILLRQISSAIFRPRDQTNFGVINTDFDKLISYVRHPSTQCDVALFLGGALGDNGKIDGDKIICQNPGRPLKETCLVYSFGGNDEWSFEDAVEKIGCNVYTFDPGMNQTSFKRSPKSWFYRIGISNFNEDKVQLKKMTTWHMRTFDEILKMLGHENNAIDVLKIDIEGDEWNVMEHMLKSKLFSQVQHLCVEVHLHSPDWKRKLDILKRLETEAGFRFFSSRENLVTSSRKVPGIPGKTEQLFYELSWYKENEERNSLFPENADFRKTKQQNF